MKLAGRLAVEYMQKLEARSTGVVQHISTGFESIDRGAPCALHEDHLVILAGRPGMGKTALSQQIAENVAEDGRTVIFFTLEMSSGELAERSIARRSGMTVPRLKSRDFDDEEHRRLKNAAYDFGMLPMLIDDESFTIKELVAKAKKVAAELAKRKMPPLGAIFVDYLQLVGAKGENRTLEVGQVVRELKLLARALSVPVVALSQLNRAVETRADKRPTMSDLRESGGIEQDADLILFVYRQDYYEVTGGKKRVDGAAEIIVGKNRHGPTGVCNMRFVGECVRFEEIAR